MIDCVTIDCRQCGTPFTPSDPRAVYCSKLCKRRYETISRRHGRGFKPCAVEGCTRQVKNGGAHCAMHHSRLKRTGHLGPAEPVIVRIEGPLGDHLLAHRQITEGGCWRWTLRHHKAGYGLIGLAGFVHRVAYELWVGPIPDCLELDHVLARGCVYKDCFNPAHLEPVTHQENMARIQRKPKTHCKRGHDLAVDGAINNRGARYCKACGRELARERRLRAS